MEGNTIPMCSSICAIKAGVTDDQYPNHQLRSLNNPLILYTMFKNILIAFIAAVSAVSAIPASTSKIVESVRIFVNRILLVSLTVL